MSDPVMVSLITAASSVAVAFIVHPRKRLKAIDERTKRELENNHGSSMKDDVDGMATGFGLLQRRLDTLLAVAAVHHPEHAHMYLALRSDHDQ